MPDCQAPGCTKPDMLKRSSPSLRASCAFVLVQSAAVDCYMRSRQQCPRCAAVMRPNCVVVFCLLLESKETLASSARGTDCRCCCSGGGENSPATHLLLLHQQLWIYWLLGPLFLPKPTTAQNRKTTMRFVSYAPTMWVLNIMQPHAHPAAALILALHLIASHCASVPAARDSPTFTKRRLYLIRFIARPVGFFFFSCLGTLGVWPRTLPARARDP